MPARGRLRARSWLTLREPAAIRITRRQDLEPGDVVVLWRERPDTELGHVGLFAREEGWWLHLFGGNQSNACKFKPYARNRFIEGRRLMVEAA